MSYHLQMTLHNSADAMTRVVVAKGTLFEVQDPFSRVQNLVTETTTEYALGPGETRAVVVGAWCFNERYASPIHTPMQLTSLQAVTSYTSQSDVWNDQRARTLPSV